MAGNLLEIQPRWLKLKAAMVYSAIGRDRLKALAQSGELLGFPDPDSGRGDWIFDRLSLDAYREAQAAAASYSSVQAKARAILASVK